MSAWRELRVRPATPEIMVVWYQCGRQRLLTNRSDTNEAEEAELSCTMQAAQLSSVSFFEWKCLHYHAYMSLVD